MNIKLVRNINLSQKLAITPSLRKSIELLQLSRNELLQTIKNSVNENPFLSNDSDYDNSLTKKKLILTIKPYALPSFIQSMRIVFSALRLTKLKRY